MATDPKKPLKPLFAAGREFVSWHNFAPGGANMVTAPAKGAPGFASSVQPLYGVFEGAKPLPPNTRLSFRTVSCGADGVVTSCLNNADQSGFVLSPAGSYTFG